ncbi:MAG: hypothetical protein AAF664_20085 [Planctomycetota bacterium]
MMPNPAFKTRDDEARFVILLHRVGDSMARTQEDHWDWMFDMGETLWTFATNPLPSPLGNAFSSDITPLTPHRRIYLNFEGEISGDRGSVQRLASGQFLVRTGQLGAPEIGLTLEMQFDSECNIETFKDHSLWTVVIKATSMTGRNTRPDLK